MPRLYPDRRALAQSLDLRGASMWCKSADTALAGFPADIELLLQAADVSLGIVAVFLGCWSRDQAFVDQGWVVSVHNLFMGNRALAQRIQQD